jgi:lipopolysaccharide export system permease protein
VRRLDRYILTQFLRAFGFFALIFTGVVWLTQAVRLLDTVVLAGQGAAVFIEFSTLVLPQVFMIVLPLAGLGATLFTANKLYTEAELVVMMAAGAGPFLLLRPAMAFGVLLCAAMALITLVLAPLGGSEIAERRQEIRSDLVNTLIVERQFVHPTTGLTLFIAETGRVGEMAGLFLHDARDPAQPVTYTAERAQLLRDGMQARLVMLDGVALTRAAGASLNTVAFEQFVFDLTGLLEGRGPREPRPEEYPVLRLLAPDAEMLASERYSRGAYVSEGHWKLVLPLLAMLYPAVALVTLLGGRYRRGGFGVRVVASIAICVALYVYVFVLRSRVEDNAELWPLFYLGPLAAVAYVVLSALRIAGPRGPAAITP